MSDNSPNNQAVTSDGQENSSECLKTEPVDLKHSPYILTETESLQQIRNRTFSHRPQGKIPSSSQMIEAGFFYCNVGDRVICIYCNLICQQWAPHIDNPCEVHKTLSPDCMYVKLKLMRPEPPPPPPIINTNERLIEGISNNYSLTSTNLVLTAAHHPGYSEIPKRHESFGTWPNKNSPSIDELVQAGFFYTPTNTCVTCFYCNGSLRGWDTSHDPTIEHARYFPHCAYARQLCGDKLYRKIQESNRPQQVRARVNEMKDNGERLSMSDKDIISRMVPEKLKLPMSQNLVKQNFEISIIKNCWEDQLRLKKVDFTSEFDLYIAYLVLEKQIEHINDKKKDIIIPSESMEQHRERASEEQAAILSREQAEVPANPEIPNPCVRCWQKEKRLACMPCGHFAICIPCRQELRQCPICRKEIETFIRIYI